MAQDLWRDSLTPYELVHSIYDSANNGLWQVCLSAWLDQEYWLYLLEFSCRGNWKRQLYGGCKTFLFIIVFKLIFSLCWEDFLCSEIVVILFYLKEDITTILHVYLVLVFVNSPDRWSSHA